MSHTSSFSDVTYPLEALTLNGIACGSEITEDNIILCLHGWLDNAGSFLPLIPFFQKNLPDHYIVAIDWPGHGNSTHKSLDAHYHFIDWVYDLLQLIEINQWKNINIVAHSMGGMVASAFAAAFPEKVKSLTLLDSIGFISADAEQTTKQLRDGMLSRLRNSNLNKVNGQEKKKNFHATIDSAVKARVNVSDLNYDNAKLIVERGIVDEATGYRWRSDARLRNTSPYRLTLLQAQQIIRDIKCPVQLIHGSNGMDMVSLGKQAFGSLFANFSSFELEGGHHIHMEQPETTVELVKQFLEQL